MYKKIKNLIIFVFTITIITTFFASCSQNHETSGTKPKTSNINTQQNSNVKPIIINPGIPVQVQNQLIRRNFTDDKSNILVKMSISLPLIENPKNDPALDNINSYYNDEMMQYSAQIEKTLVEKAKDLLKSTPNTKLLPFQATQNYSVSFNDGNFLSVYRTINEFSGGDRVNTTLICNTFDVTTGKQIKLEDLFTVPEDVYMDRIRSMVIKNIEAKLKINNGFYFDDYTTGIINYYFKEDFYLAKDGLVVAYQKGAIAPSSSGLPSFKIPYSELQDIMKFKF